MPEYEWIVDTWVLETASNLDDPRALDSIHFLLEVRSHHSVAIDLQGQILKEYSRHFVRGSVVTKWWETLRRFARIAYYDGHLPQTHATHLVAVLGFDRSDLKFVAVASKGSDKFLVSEDSDYSEPVRDYLFDELGITTFTISNALTTAKT